MVKLFKATNRLEDSWWCFAPDALSAKKIITKQVFDGKQRKFNIEDVTSEHIQDDGVDYLIKHNFVGIPQQSIFMLNGCMSSMHEHYDVKKRSAVRWWAKEIPESKELLNV